MSDSELTQALRSYDKNDVRSVVHTYVLLERQGQVRKLQLPSFEVLNALPTRFVDGTGIKAHEITPSKLCYSWDPLRDWELVPLMLKRARRTRHPTEAKMVEDVFGTRKLWPGELKPNGLSLRHWPRDPGYLYLKENIAAFGVLHPVTIDEHKRVVNGVARTAVCRDLGIQVPCVLRIAEHALSQEEFIDRYLGRNRYLGRIE